MYGVLPSSLVIGSVCMDHNFERHNHEVVRKLRHHKMVLANTPPFGQNMFSPWSSHDGDLFLSR